MNLDDDLLSWVLDTFEWLTARQTGPLALSRHQLVLPTPEFFPLQSGDGLPVRLLSQVQALAGLGGFKFKIEPLDDPDDEIKSIWSRMPGEQSRDGAAGLIDLDPANLVVPIWYDPAQLRDPMAFVATLAHEVAHVVVGLAGSEPPGGWEVHEQATDVAAVFLGFGIFLCNSAFRFEQWQDSQMQGWSTSRQGYLGEAELAHVLALFCLTKNIAPKNALRHLKTNPKSYCKKAHRLLRRKYGDRIEAIRMAELPDDGIEQEHGNEE